MPRINDFVGLTYQHYQELKGKGLGDEEAFRLVVSLAIHCPRVEVEKKTNS